MDAWCWRLHPKYSQPHEAFYVHTRSLPMSCIYTLTQVLTSSCLLSCQMGTLPTITHVASLSPQGFENEHGRAKSAVYMGVNIFCLAWYLNLGLEGSLYIQLGDHAMKIAAINY